MYKFSGGGAGLLAVQGKLGNIGLVHGREPVCGLSK
jgi:hypothetical protein